MPIVEATANSASITYTAINTAAFNGVDANSAGVASDNFIWESLGLYPVDGNAIGVATVTGDGLLTVADGFTDNLSDSFETASTFGTLDEIALLTDTFSFQTQSLFGAILAELEDYFAFGDSITVEYTPVPYVDTFTLANSEELSVTNLLESIINISSSYPETIQTTQLKSTGFFGDVLRSAIVISLTDTFNLSDAQSIVRIANLLDILNISDTRTGTLNALASLSSTFHVDEYTSIGLAEFLVSTGLFTTTETELIYQLETLTSSLTVQDVQIYSTDQLAELIDAFNLSSSINFDGSVYNVAVISTLEMGDVLYAPDFGAVAWVMNTQGESIAPFVNFGFNSIAYHGGKVFATSPEGIFVLGGNQDNGRKIDAHIKYGFNDFGSDYRKRASDLYVSYTGGELECSIETYDGPKTVYNYPIQDREANAPRNNRMKVGRGLVSRYWRTEIHNLQGATFKVYDVGLNTVTSKRRL